MNKILIISERHYKDGHGGGISTAMNYLLRELEGVYNIEFCSYCDEIGKKRPLSFYFVLLYHVFFRRNVTIYVNGLFAVHSSIMAIFLIGFSKNLLILSPRGMLKSSALNNSRIKLMVLKFLQVVLKNSTRVHVTDGIELSESRLFFPELRHFCILDFPPPRDEVFVNRLKKCQELSLIYVGRIDDLKNLYNVLLALEKVSFSLDKIGFISNGNFRFLIIGQKVDTDYFEKCQVIISKIKKDGLIDICYLDYLQHHEVIDLLRKQHLYISLSRGENYGYTIAEALANSVPVIITRNSPFGRLNHIKLGSVVDDSDLDGVVNEVLKYFNMSEVEYSILVRNVYKEYETIFNSFELRKKYNELFNV